MTRRRDLSPEEAKLWRRVAKTTKPYMVLSSETAPTELQRQMVDVVVAPPTPELPHLALKRAKMRRVLLQPALAPKKTAIIRPIADASGHKKVRRGKLDIDARIDLHGMRQIEAQTALAGTIARTRAANGRCILVVTGKGRPIDPGEDYITPQPGVIKRRLPEWLGGAGIREHISGYAPANAKDGGTGAFYVLLKSNPKKL
jgi:DNA-nicking Smr family endonuclease